MNSIWHLIWCYLSKPVLGGHPVLSGHYSIPHCPRNTGFTVHVCAAPMSWNLPSLHGKYFCAFLLQRMRNDSLRECVCVGGGRSLIHSLHGQNQKSRSSVFLCSRTKQKHWLCRLESSLLNNNYTIYIYSKFIFSEYGMSYTVCT